MREVIGGYKNLEVWQLGRRLVKLVYQVTAKMPTSEQFGLTAQLRRAAVSVPCNIAEGWGRNTDASFTNFLRIARGSLNEVETLLILSQDLEFLNEGDTTESDELIVTAGRKLYNLIEKIKPSLVREERPIYGANEVPLGELEVTD